MFVHSLAVVKVTLFLEVVVVKVAPFSVAVVKVATVLEVVDVEVAVLEVQLDK